MRKIHGKRITESITVTKYEHKIYKSLTLTLEGKLAII